MTNDSWFARSSGHGNFCRSQRRRIADSDSEAWEAEGDDEDMEMEEYEDGFEVDVSGLRQ